MLNAQNVLKTLKRHSFPHLNQLLQNRAEKEKEEVLSECLMLHHILMEEVAEQERSESARRRSKRYPVQALCTVSTEEGSERIFIQDVSETGMRAKVLPTFYSLICSPNEFDILIPYKKIVEGEWVEKKAECHARMIRLSEEKGSTMVSFDFFHKSDEDKKNLKEFITYYAKDSS